MENEIRIRYTSLAGFVTKCIKIAQQNNFARVPTERSINVVQSSKNDAKIFWHSTMLATAKSNRCDEE